MKKKARSPQSLSALAAGLSAHKAPRDPLVAALARKGGPAAKAPPRTGASPRLTSALTEKSAAAATKPPPPRAGPSQRPTSALTAKIAPLTSKPAPARGVSSSTLATKPAGAPPSKIADVARSHRITAGLMAQGAAGPVRAEPRRSESQAKPTPVEPGRRSRVPVPASKATPLSRPGPSSGVSAALAGTSRTAAAVAPLVKAAVTSRAAPAKPEPKPAGAKLAAHRRKYPRAELQVRARLALADDPSHTFEASLPTANVSVGGLFLESTFFIKLGTRLSVHLSLPPHGREVHVKGQVVRIESTNSSHSGFALRFTDYLDGSEVVLATHFLSPVLREFIQQYALGNGFKATAEYVANTADVLAAWELRRAELGGDVWVIPGD